MKANLVTEDTCSRCHMSGDGWRLPRGHSQTCGAGQRHPGMQGCDSDTRFCYGHVFLYSFPSLLKNITDHI